MSHTGSDGEKDEATRLKMEMMVTVAIDMK